MKDLHRWINDDLMHRQHKMTWQAMEHLGFLAHGRDVIIEVGAFAGTVTNLFTVFGRTVHTVDHFRGDWAAGEFDPDKLSAAFRANNAEALEAGRLHLWQMPSAEAAPRMAAKGILADLIWIDGDHSYEGCKADIENYLPLLKPGGVICGHDAGSFEGVTRAVNELLPEAFWFSSWMWTHCEGQRLAGQYGIEFETTTIPGVTFTYADGTQAVAVASIAEDPEASALFRNGADAQ